MASTKAFAANVYGQVCTIFIQLISVPVFLSGLGVEKYGQWLVLSAIPIYISLSDFGLVSVSCNKALLSFFSDEKSLANYWWNKSKDITLYLIMFSTLLAASLELISRGDAATVMVLSTSAFIGMRITTNEYLFRMKGMYHLGVIYNNTARLIEFIVMSFTLFLTTNLFLIALSGAMAKIIFLIIFRIYPPEGIVFEKLKNPWVAIRSIWKDSLTMMMYPVSNMAAIQGMTLVISNILDPVAVVIYSATRTYARVLTQISVVFNNSLSPIFAQYYAGHRCADLVLLLKKYMVITFGAVTFSSILLVEFSDYVFRIWTSDKLQPDGLLIFLGVAISFVNALWLPQKIFFQSTNNHGKFGMFYFFVSNITIAVAAIALSYYKNVASVLATALAAELLLLIAAIVHQRMILKANA